MMSHTHSQLFDCSYKIVWWDDWYTNCKNKRHPGKLLKLYRLGILCV